FEESGTIVQITGNYDDYLLYCERRREEEKQSRAQQSRPARPAVPVKRPGLTYHEKQELAGIEQTILDAEEQVARLQEAINGPGFYGRDFTETQAVLQRLKEAEAEVARLYQRWEALETGR
ncbi:MAG TPA: hypothetical protein PLC40_15280, partial [Candidatus Hydrogenedentes bacterium]|nr:hypothetical protein [Candidatus Hydrogenedentota bacterium]